MSTYSSKRFKHIFRRLMASVTRTVLAFALLALCVGTASAKSIGAVSGLQAQVVPAVSGFQIVLTWTAPATGYAVSGYNIYRGTVSGGEDISLPINGATPITSTTYTDTAVGLGSTYYYIVSPINDEGEGTASNEVSATPIDTPTIATPAAASPSPVTGKTTTLTVLGACIEGEPSLTYSWTATGPAPVTFSANGTNGAKLATATFTLAGSYLFTVTIATPGGQTATSSTTVVVAQTPAKVYVSPSPGSVVAGHLLQMIAAAKDQFGNLISPNPTALWSVTSGGGSISAAGVYTAPASAGSAIVTATMGTVNASSSITITAGSGGSGGLLSGVVANPGPQAVNLTTEGTTDWIHWGSGVPGIVRKASGGSQISSYTLVGNSTPTILISDSRSCSWTDGTPTATASNNKGGLSLAGASNGFTFTAPADLTLRTLTVYVGGKGEGGKLTAHISDGSSPDYVNIQPSAAGQWDATYTISYQAAVAGQTVQISWLQNSGSGTISLTAADLH